MTGRLHAAALSCIPPEMRLTLVIPPDAGRSAEAAAGRRLPALEILLARANREAGRADSYESLTCSLFRCVGEAELPIGAVRRVGDGAVPDEAWWYCAEPVHLIADRDRLHLIGPAELAVTATEAEALVFAFNQHFGPDGWHLEAPHPSRWYLRAPAVQTVRTTPLERAVASDLHAALPAGTEGLRWHAFLNEVQMLFFPAAVNAVREQAGLPVVNGIWPWGGGRAPHLTPVFGTVMSDEPLARGAAQLSGAKLAPFPAVFTANAGPEVVLAVANGLSWAELERDWGAPLLAALHDAELEELTLYAGANVWHLTRHSLRRWWRRRRALKDYL